MEGQLLNGIGHTLHGEQVIQYFRLRPICQAQLLLHCVSHHISLVLPFQAAL